MESRSLSRARSWALRRLSHAARRRVPGKGAGRRSDRYLSGAPADLARIARYLKTLTARRGTQRQFVAEESTTTALNAGDFSAAGSGLYFKQCGSCHGLDGRGHGKLLPPLAGNPTVIDDAPSSVINIVLNGAGRIVTGGVPSIYPRYRYILSKDMGYQSIHVGTNLLQMKFPPTFGGLRATA